MSECRHDAIYGPIIIGGPCRLCGFSHAGMTCDEHQEQQRAAVHRLFNAVRAARELRESNDFEVSG